jgi:hypothetical protein
LAQQDASERLHQVTETLSKQQGQKPRAHDGDREGSGSGAAARSEAKVRIHSADEFRGPAELRRKLLDAMRESAPETFRAAVERYYEELMK